MSLSLSLSFSLDDLRVGPQKLRLLISLTGSAMGDTYTDDRGGSGGSVDRGGGVDCYDESGCGSDMI